MRRYEEATWVSTTYSAFTQEQLNSMGTSAFNKLFMYIDGANENGKSLIQSSVTMIIVL